MKLRDYEIPDDFLYTKEHEWAKQVDAYVRVGITDYAAKTLNDVVYVAPPKVGDTIMQFKSMGTVESIKAVSELYSPISGTIARVNTNLDSHPELVNKSPYSEGWLIDVNAFNFASEKAQLLSAIQYSEHVGSVLK